MTINTDPTQLTLEAVRLFNEQSSEAEPKIGDGKLINNIKTQVLYEDDEFMGEPDVASASKIKDQKKMPGQFIGGRGTTIYNPLRSDPRVEAILGSHNYKEKPREDTIPVVKLKMTELENQVKALTNILASKVQTMPESDVCPVTVKSLNDMKFGELRVLAKEKGISVPLGTKKDELILKLNEVVDAQSLA